MMLVDNNSTVTNIESWFIPTDILKIIFALLAIIFSVILLFIIIIDKTCHSVPMMLVANSCLIQLIYAIDVFILSLFTFENDLQKIQFCNLFCIIGGGITYMTTGIQMYSYFLQAIYRYIIVIYPSHLFYQSSRFQFFLICLTWICGIIYVIPLIFTGQIVYHVDDQICQMPLRLSFLIIFNASYIYIIPLISIILIYIKMVLYVKEISKRIVPINILFRAQRELRMIRHIVCLVFILLVLGLPYVLFILMSFFNSTPKYHFRIAYIFINASLALILIILFEISDPVKAFLMKRINRQRNRIIPTMT